jgi:RNA polymerase sigma factor (sigma-70 family)
MLEKTLADDKALIGRCAGSKLHDTLSDSQLLDLFANRHAEAAFAALVRRHGPMVLSVCRRVLRHSQDAEDACQATFLVLAKKAHQLQRPSLLANWLYGVAYRTALHARQRAAVRSAHEREAASMSDLESNPDQNALELRRLLDEELNRLPEKYRAPLVLCNLEGKTNEEAARLLGWPSGSMSHRLARGRELLRERLASRLAGLSALLPLLPLAEYLQPAAVPPALAEVTVHAAVALVGAKMAAVGASLISDSVRELMEETLHSLAPSRWSWLLAAVLLLLLLLSVSVLSCYAFAFTSQSFSSGGGCSHSASP